MKKMAKVVVGAGVAVLTVIVILNHFDSQTIPKTVDRVRSIIGERNTLRLEEAGYGVINFLDEKRFAVKKDLGNQALAAPFVRKKPANFYELTQARGDLDAIIDIAIIDLDQVDLHLVCGTRDPAKGSGIIPVGDKDRLVMAFSGGFQYQHDRGGIAFDGHALRPMKKNAGTLIVFQDGRVVIGKWGRDFTELSPEMKYVRQCLLLVDKGKFNDREPFDAYVLGRGVRVFRSALGITKGGKLVYAAGNKISAKSLAEAMMANGVISAICLDMNYGNATCGVVSHQKGKISIKPLTERFPDPRRFLGTNYRDFFYLTSS